MEDSKLKQIEAIMREMGINHRDLAILLLIRGRDLNE